MKVINGKKDGFIGEDTIYIGRYNSFYELESSPLANRYRTAQYKSLKVVLKKYKEWIFSVYACKQGDAYDELMRLVDLHRQGKEINLACWCKPKACHGDVIKQVVEFIVEHEQSDRDLER